MQAKKAVLAEKQAILEEVIGEALHRLTNLPDSEYTETIGTMLDSIDKNLGNGDNCVRARQKTISRR